MLREAADNGCVVAGSGTPVGEKWLLASLRHEFASADKPLVLLAAVTAVVAIGGWYTACYLPLHYWASGDQVVGWAIAPLEQTGPSARSSQTSLIVYTFIAYCWMGAALFVYIASLFANLIYASFFYKLATGVFTADDGSIVQLISRKNLPKHLSEYLYNFLAACLLGFVAAFLMQLESQYLLSNETMISNFWFGDLKFLSQLKDAVFQGIELPTADFQAAGAKDQTLYTSLAVLAATLVAFGAGIWLVQATLRASRAYTVSLALHPDFLRRIGMTISSSDVEKLECRDELTQVFPTLKTAATICLGLIFCTLFPRFGILFSSLILVTVYRYLTRQLGRVINDT